MGLEGDITDLQWTKQDEGWVLGWEREAGGWTLGSGGKWGLKVQPPERKGWGPGLLHLKEAGLGVQIPGSEGRRSGEKGKGCLPSYA